MSRLRRSTPARCASAVAPATNDAAAHDARRELSTGGERGGALLVVRRPPVRDGARALTGRRDSSATATRCAGDAEKATAVARPCRGAVSRAEAAAADARAQVSGGAHAARRTLRARAVVDDARGSSGRAWTGWRTTSSTAHGAARSAQARSARAPARSSCREDVVGVRKRARASTMHEMRRVVRSARTRWTRTGAGGCGRVPVVRLQPPVDVDRQLLRVARAPRRRCHARQAQLAARCRSRLSAPARRRPSVAAHARADCGSSRAATRRRARARAPALRAARLQRGRADRPTLAAVAAREAAAEERKWPAVRPRRPPAPAAPADVAPCRGRACGR